AAPPLAAGADARQATGGPGRGGERSHHWQRYWPPGGNSARAAPLPGANGRPGGGAYGRYPRSGRDARFGRGADSVGTAAPPVSSGAGGAGSLTPSLAGDAGAPGGTQRAEPPPAGECAGVRALQPGTANDRRASAGPLRHQPGQRRHARLLYRQQGVESALNEG